MDPAWNSCDLQYVEPLVEILLPGAVTHHATLLKPGFNNSGLISQGGLRATYEPLVMYLKISLEDASQFLPVKPAPLGGSRGINTPFHGILRQERGKVRGDLSLARQHMFLCLPSPRLRHQIITIHQLLLQAVAPRATPDLDWRIRRLSFPYLSFLVHATEAPSPLHFTGRNIHTNIKTRLLEDLHSKYTSAKLEDI